MTLTPLTINSVTDNDSQSNRLIVLDIKGITYKNFALATILHPVIAPFTATESSPFFNTIKLYRSTALYLYHYINTKTGNVIHVNVLPPIFSRVL